ncbi:MAG: hypothetical protein AAFZ58_00470 [Pseudomonadota bacterium]
MADVFASCDLVFDDASAAALCLERIENDADAARYQYEGGSVDNGYVSAELEVFDGFDPAEFVAFLESQGARGVLISVFDESGEDEETFCRLNGKKAHAGSVRKAIEAAAPAYAATDALDHSTTRKLKKLLDDGLDPNASAYKQSLVYQAAEKARRDNRFLKLLLEYGGDPNSVGSHFQWEPGCGAPQYESALFCIVKDSKHARDEAEAATVLDSVRLLLEHGADPNLTGRDAECSMLQLAAIAAPLPVLEMLLEAGTQGQPQPESPLTDMRYAHHRYVKAVETLDKLRSDIDDDQNEFVIQANGQVQVAVGIIRRLLDAGVAPEVVDHDGTRLGLIVDLVPELNTNE